ncbi:Htaa protein [Herbihabitans rhizosphaerae]|uniref:Htaa protein n=1 Tax=Herbihabitans rhizosphaerae TaxID=1872711 RepID=A0A4Q7L7I8_9PSEU|nr:HtaA domain-containing protein [Herbihabitans rhizosphaerae]RZS44601.1 Htaa protein [Herbihabitans rhizosphaerae]
MTTRNDRRRPVARVLAAALVAAVGTLGLFTGTATAEPSPVTGGHLDWGVKESFRKYITGPIAHGTITTSDGATANADGTFRFPSASGDADAGADTAKLAFAGKIEFSGHDTQLYITMTDIRVTLTGSGGTLVADVVSKSRSTGELVTYDDVAFATLADTDLIATDGTITATDVGATLTEAGVPAFADFYPAGTALDPLTFSVTTAPKPVWQPVVKASKTSGIDPAGETITVTGSGFDPAANVGTRPPLAGKPTGVYLVFAKITQPWRPSEGAPSSSRTVLDQKWVLPAASRAIVDPAGTNPDYVELKPDGTFTGTLDVAAVSQGVDCRTDTCGVITYAAGGAVNAAHELFTPLAFATTPTTPSSPSQPSVAPSPGPAQPAPPPAGAVTSARLEWGVKESFRNYIKGSIAHGSWTLDGVTGGGPFVWTNLTSGTDDEVVFGGGVRFTGHNGLLDLTISQPRMRFAGSTAELLLDVRSKGLQNPNEFVELNDVVFATLTLGTPTVQNGIATYSAMRAVLTPQGSSGFAGFYQAGAELDPVTVSIAKDGASLPPPGAGGSGNTGDYSGSSASTTKLASTGVDTGPLTGLGAALIVGGTGLLVLSRRRRVTA